MVALLDTGYVTNGTGGPFTPKGDHNLKLSHFILSFEETLCMDVYVKLVA